MSIREKILQETESASDNILAEGIRLFTISQNQTSIKIP
jgi:hypothetical protein